MSLSVGIVGLPNVGKSTLFNALLKRSVFAKASDGQAGGVAKVENYPFTTIEPNVGIVPVEDERLHRLAQIVADEHGKDQHPTSPMKHRGSSPQPRGGKVQSGKKPKVVPATVKFVDIAGLVAGAHKGEGLGNQFLAHIRECDLICHVLREFEDENVAKAGSVSPLEDLKTVRMELMLKDLETLEKQREKSKKQNHREKLKIIGKIIQHLNNGMLVHRTDLCKEEREIVEDLFLLTLKPEMVVLNVLEEKLGKAREDSVVLFQHPTSPMKHRGSSPQLPCVAKGYAGGAREEGSLGIEKKDIFVLSAKLESELGSLSEEDQKLYLKELGIKNSAVERLVKRTYEKLGLISFFTTTGSKEIRSWSIKKGTPVIEAAGIIHSDFRDKFIKAKVIDWRNFVKFGGWTKAKEAGKIRFEGKDYQIKEGEVVEIAI